MMMNEIDPGSMPELPSSDKLDSLVYSFESVSSVCLNPDPFVIKRDPVSDQEYMTYPVSVRDLAPDNESLVMHSPSQKVKTLFRQKGWKPILDVRYQSHGGVCGWHRLFWSAPVASCWIVLKGVKGSSH